MSQIKDKLPNGKKVSSSGKRVYNKALKIDGFEEALKSATNQSQLVEGKPPSGWPHTPETLVKEISWMTPELAEEIKQAAGGSGFEFQLISRAYVGAINIQTNNEVTKASNDAATKLADKAGLTGEERKRFIQAQAKKLREESLEATNSGQKNPRRGGGRH